jgi:hypothetical protein
MLRYNLISAKQIYTIEIEELYFTITKGGNSVKYILDFLNLPVGNLLEDFEEIVSNYL